MKRLGSRPIFRTKNGFIAFSLVGGVALHILGHDFAAVVFLSICLIHLMDA